MVGTIHIHDLAGEGTEDGDGWYATIEVRVRNDAGRNQRGVVVSGRFTGGVTQLVSGSTNPRGRVTFESGPVDGASVTFTIIDLVHPDYAYAPENNRQGPSVTVEFEID